MLKIKPAKNERTERKFLFRGLAATEGKRKLVNPRGSIPASREE